MIDAIPWWCAGFLLTLALSHLWRRLGWGDAAVGEESVRKLQQGRVPAVGGLALASIWLVQWLTGSNELPLAHPLVLVGFTVTLGGGVVDDFRKGGLRPLVKVAIQLVGGLCIGLALFDGAGIAGIDSWIGSVLVMGLMAVLFTNASNTFDNADGALGSVSGLGLVLVGSALAPAILGFLVPNLLLRRRSGGGLSLRSSCDPIAYLGDGGSQLIGLVLLTNPAAWGVVVLPALDLFWVACLRIRQGDPPWRGDRRHLAHRLQRRGMGPLGVVGVLLVIALPALIGAWSPLTLMTPVLFLLAQFLTRASEALHLEEGR